MNNYIDSASSFFAGKFGEFGTSPQGVDWGTAESQDRRLLVLLRALENHADQFSIGDVGCGYGRLIDLIDSNLELDYSGYEISHIFTDFLRDKFSADLRKKFNTIVSLDDLGVHDYLFASGIFNKRFDTSDEQFFNYIKESLTTFFARSRVAVAVNFLSIYSDPDLRREDLFYADPLQVFDYVKRNISEQVILYHDYGHWDFTIVIKKGSF